MLECVVVPSSPALLGSDWGWAVDDMYTALKRQSITVHLNNQVGNAFMYGGDMQHAKYLASLGDGASLVALLTARVGERDLHGGALAGFPRGGGQKQLLQVRWLVYMGPSQLLEGRCGCRPCQGVFGVWHNGYVGC